MKKRSKQLLLENESKNIDDKRLKKFIKKDNNMFAKKTIKMPTVKFRVHKMTKIQKKAN